MRREYTLMHGKWAVTVWYEATAIDADEITDDLVRAGCSGKDLYDCKEALWSNEMNVGLTYVNNNTHMGVVVIGKATNKKEYANTLSHEIGHLTVFLADDAFIDCHSEAFCYLLGDITQAMWSDAHKIICPSCSRDASGKSRWRKGKLL